MVEDHRAKADRCRRDLDELVVVDELERVLERELTRRGEDPLQNPRPTLPFQINGRPGVSGGAGVGSVGARAGVANQGGSSPEPMSGGRRPNPVGESIL